MKATAGSIPLLPEFGDGETEGIFDHLPDCLRGGTLRFLAQEIETAAAGDQAVLLARDGMGAVDEILDVDLPEDLCPHLRLPLVLGEAPAGRLDQPEVMLRPLDLEEVEEAPVFRPADRVLVAVIGGDDQGPPLPDRREGVVGRLDRLVVVPADVAAVGEDDVVLPLHRARRRSPERARWPPGGPRRALRRRSRSGEGPCRGSRSR